MLSPETIRAIEDNYYVKFAALVQQSEPLYRFDDRKNLNILRGYLHKQNVTDEMLAEVGAEHLFASAFVVCKSRLTFYPTESQKQQLRDRKRREFAAKDIEGGSRDGNREIDDPGGFKSTAKFVKDAWDAKIALEQEAANQVKQAEAVKALEKAWADRPYDFVDYRADLTAQELRELPRPVLKYYIRRHREYLQRIQSEPISRGETA